MAISIKKKVDTEKYKHLEKLYKDGVEEKIVLEKNDEVVVIQKDLLSIDRKQLLTNVLVVFLLGALAVSGYVLARFL
jgi:hypothetical protein